MTSEMTDLETRQEECCNATVFLVFPNPFMREGLIGRRLRRSRRSSPKSSRGKIQQWLYRYLKETSFEPFLSLRASWLRGGLEGQWYWARSLDDLATCPLRAFYSSAQAKGSIPYSLGGFEFQKKAITILKSLDYFEAFADPGVRGLRTHSDALTICASFGEVRLCGRPDFVGLFSEPFVAWVVEVVQTSDWRKTLKRSIYRLAFYVQGVHEFFGLPISLSVFTPDVLVWIKLDKEKWVRELERKVEELKEISNFETALRRAKRVKSKPCQSCAYKRICPLSRE